MERVTTIGNRQSPGFSLVELLLVIAVMTLLLVLAVPAVNSTLDGSNLQRSGFLISDVVQQARQFAAALNTPVEVRVYEIPVDGDKRWCAFRILAADPMDSDSSFTALTRLLRLNGATAVVPEHSPILGQAGISGTESLPAQGGNRAYRGFRIRPDGSLETLPGANANYLTIIHARHLANAGQTLPANFITVQINPYTGTPVIYQP